MFDFNIGFDNFIGKDPNVLFVCAMGVGTVFIGLICLVLVCKILGLLLNDSNKKSQVPATPIIQPPVEQPIENKQELLAAIAAAVAEELGTDVNGIRITSFKKL